MKVPRTKTAKKSRRYQNRVYNELGIIPMFWARFVVPNVIRIKGNKCENCGQTKGMLDVHHNDLDELTINTLVVYCRKCHRNLHKSYDN